jgi:hypothetical protein
MKRFAKFILLGLLSGAIHLPAQAAAQDCAANWSPDSYKSFDTLQNEVKKKYGEVRILRVALCNSSSSPYFQVVIISGNGEVRRVQVAAGQ